MYFVICSCTFSMYFIIGNMNFFHFLSLFKNLYTFHLQFSISLFLYISIYIFLYISFYISLSIYLYLSISIYLYIYLFYIDELIYLSYIDELIYLSYIDELIYLSCIDLFNVKWLDAQHDTYSTN